MGIPKLLGRCLAGWFLFKLATLGPSVRRLPKGLSELNKQPTSTLESPLSGPSELEVGLGARIPHD